MTLVVTVRVPDGIVMASDTLMTVNQTAPPQQKSGGQSIVATTHFPASETAQKVFSFRGVFAIGMTGDALVAGDSMAFLLEELEDELESSPASGNMTVEQASDKIFARVHQRKKAAKDKSRIQLLVTGYNGMQPCFVGGHVDSVKVMENPVVGMGANASGFTQVFSALGGIAPVGHRYLSLADAVEYARFHVRAARDQQRFSLIPQTVGGRTDVGIVTRRKGFRWLTKHSPRLMTEGLRS